MSIRNAAKAIIVHENKVLFNLSHRPDLGEYCLLPGGGQNQYETMEEAVIRECLEETGYSVRPEALCAVFEEIYTSEDFRREHPDYAHKIFHIFKCSLSSQTQVTPTELDAHQKGCVWVDINEIDSIRLYPKRVHERFHEIMQADAPLYLGSESVTF